MSCHARGLACGRARNSWPRGGRVPAVPGGAPAGHAGRPCAIHGDWWRKRAAEALNRREGLFDARTTGFRLINGESDGWPGLVLDRYDDTLVLKIYTAAWLSRLAEVAGLLAA